MSEFVEKYYNEINEKSFNSSNEIIYWANKDGQVFYANSSSLKILGYTLDELQTKFVWDIDTILDTKEKYDESLKKIGNGSSIIIESFYRKKNGETFPVEITSKFTRIDDNEFVISYVRDITQRLKRTEDINFYFDLIDSSSDMIFLFEDGTWKLEFANQTACDVLEYTLVELRKMKLSDFRVSSKQKRNIDFPEIFEKIEQMSNMTSFGIYITKSGKKIPIETSLHKKNYQGKSFIVAISRDISDRLEIERQRESLSKKLKNYNHTLQKEIFKAKEELIEYENIMKRQSKMAAMGEMLENIAHQWRQPLCAISVLSTGLVLQNEQMDIKKEQLNCFLNDINDQVQYLSRTIDDFRNFFKPTKKKNYFYLEKLINTSIKLSKAKYNNEGIKFIIDIADVELYTYENELLQVLLNLISNAKDELVRKDFKKYIFIDSFIKDSYVIIRFKDNAGGIKEEIISRIFEPYFTTKHSRMGTGIGLYMSQNIIKHMHGSIEVENLNFTYKDKEFNGACFEIKIPK